MDDACLLTALLCDMMKVLMHFKQFLTVLGSNLRHPIPGHLCSNLGSLLCGFVMMWWTTCWFNKEVVEKIGIGAMSFQMSVRNQITSWVANTCRCQGRCYYRGHLKGSNWLLGETK